MGKRNSDVVSKQDRWLQGIGVSPELFAPGTPVLQTGTSVSSAPAVSVKSPAGGAVMKSNRLPIEDIVVTPENPLIESGQTQGLTATALYQGGMTEDITGSVVWESSLPEVIDFTSPGWFVANAAGTALIRATDTVSQVSGYTKITVPVAGKVPALRKVIVSPLNPDIQDGPPVQFKATGVYSDGSRHEITDRVKWESSNPKVLAIDAKGLGKPGLVEGSALIRGSDPATGMYQSTTVYVTTSGVRDITVLPKTISLASGDAVPVMATAALYGGGQKAVNEMLQWTSSDSKVAIMIPGGGQVEGLAPGNATIEAVEPVSGLSEIIEITVLRPVLRSIMVFPGDEAIVIGQTEQFKATGFLSDRTSRDLTKVRWSSSAPEVIGINQKGVAKAKKAGKSTITAEHVASGVSGSVETTGSPS